MALNSHNEWDRLRDVVVGTAACMTAGLEFPEGKIVGPAEFERAAAVARQAFPSSYVEEVAEDLDCLCALLVRAGITVRRPVPYGAERLTTTPYWSATGRDLYNVRDLHLVVGDTVIVSAPPLRTRQYEAYSLHDIWRDVLDERTRWITAPRPKLRGQYLVPRYRVGEEFLTAEDILHRELSGGRGETWYRLLEDEILFDAATVMRCGRDVLYLVSNSGNLSGARWLQRVLDNAYRVHTTSCYRSGHLDSTILPLRSGFVLLNAARVDDTNCPAFLRSWDKLYFSDVAPVPPEELEFQETVRDRVHDELAALGVESDLNFMSSPWIGLNVLSLDPDTVAVDDRQVGLMRALERSGFTAVPVRLRHPYTMMGGLHCVTLDLVRDSVAD